MANNVNVVNRGFEYVAQMLGGNIATYTVPGFIGWGTANGSNASSVVLPASGPGGVQGAGQWFDVAPFSEAADARVQASSTAVTNNIAASGTITTQWVGTITAGSGETIAESFLVPSTTKPVSALIWHGVLNSGGGSVTVASTGFPATPFYAQLNNEVILVGTVTSSTIFTISRAQNGSSANLGNTTDTITVGNIPGGGASNPNHGDLFAHAGFVGLALNSGDSIQFTWQVNVTS